MLKVFLVATLWIASAESVFEPRCSESDNAGLMFEKMTKMEMMMRKLTGEEENNVEKIYSKVEQMMENVQKMMVQNENKVSNMSRDLDALQTKIQELSKPRDDDDVEFQTTEEPVTTAAGPTSSMGKACSSNRTCSDVAKSECRDNECKCVPGMSYQASKSACVEDCGGASLYGNTYQEVKNAALWGFYSHKTTESSAEDCMKRCTEITDISCRMAEFKRKNGMCQVSWETFITHPTKYKKNDDYDSFVRNCV